MTTHMSKAQQARIKGMLERRGRRGCLPKVMLCVAKVLHWGSPRLLKHLKARGNATIVFIVNEEEEFGELREHYGGAAGIDGFMTDRPSNLAKWVE